MINSLYNRIKRRVELSRSAKKSGIKNYSLYSQGHLDQLFIFKAEINDLKTIIDVGANEGLFSKGLTEVFNIQDVFCIEPNSNLNQSINDNLKNYNLKIFNSLVSDVEKEVEFTIYDDSQLSSIAKVSSSKMGEVYSWNDNSKTKIKKMRCVPLDKVFEMENVQLEGNVLMKIDTQGFELEVLKGAENTLSKIKYVVIEHMFDSPYEKEVDANELFSFLFNRGFVLRGPSYIANRVDGKIGSINFLFSK